MDTRELPEVTPEAPRCHRDVPRWYLEVPVAAQCRNFMDLGSPGRCQNLKKHAKAWYCRQKSRFRCLAGGCGAEGPIG